MILMKFGTQVQDIIFDFFEKFHHASWKILQVTIKLQIPKIDQ